MSTRTSSNRSLAPPNPVRVRFDRFELDEANACLLRDGTAVALAPTPFAVLCALVRQPGSLLTKDALLDEVWGHQFVSDSVLKTAISELRAAVDDDARQPRFIETVSRRGYRFIASTTAAAPSVSTSVSDAGSVQAPPFIGRADALARLKAAWDLACSGKRAVVWVAGEPGIGKTTLIEHFVAGLGEVACARGQCVEHYGAGEPYLPVLEALAELCRSDSTVAALLRAVAPTWLLQLPWLSTAEERDALRRELAGVSAGSHAARDGRVPRSLHRAPAAVAGDRGPALERPRDDPAHRLHRAAAWQRAPHVARKLSSRRGRRARPSAQPVAARAAPARPVRGDRARSVLGSGGRRLRGGAVPGDRDRRSVRARVARAHRRVAAVRGVRHERRRRARGARRRRRCSGAELAEIAVPENLAAIIEHYIAKLGTSERAVLSAAAVCGVEFRVGDCRGGARARRRHGSDRHASELAREQLWLVAPRAGEGSDAAELAVFVQARALPPGAVRAHRPARLAQSCTAKSAPRSSGSAPRACRSPLPSSPCTSSAAREPMTALRYYAEAAEAALAALQPGRVHERSPSAA